MSNLDEIRKRRLHCERALRESVLVLIGIFFLVSVLAAIALFMTAKVNFQTLLLLFPTVLATLIGLPVTWGVTRLQPWTRRPLTILSLFGLLFFPFGTICSFLIFKAIYLGESPQLLTHDYYSIVQQTQHLNHRTSLLTWIGFALIILLFASVALILLIPPEYRQ